MPMMQFSVAPWRILDEEHFSAVKKAVDLRQKFVPEILKLAENSAKTGLPIVSNMEFIFPDEGFSDCKDQFMLGQDILVAPVITIEDRREVRFPKGSWTDSNGKVIEGGQTITYDVPLDQLLWFKRV
jgi:alpha-glucosidase